MQLHQRKRGVCLLLAGILLLTLLSGCAQEDSAALPRRAAYWSDGYIDMVAFDQMEYTRPDLDAFLEQVDALIGRLQTGEISSFRAKRTLSEIDTAYFTFHTLTTLAEIRHDIDMTDAYYRDEYAYCSNGSIEIQQKLEELYAACASSPLASDLEDYFGEGFLDGYDRDYTYPEEYIALQHQENELLGEYYDLTADMTLSYNGEDYTLSALYWAADAGDLDGLTPESALELYYDTFNARVGAVYVELVKVRQQMAALYGYESYVEMAYDLNGREYTVDDVQTYTAAIRERLVPLYRRAGMSGLLDSAGDTAELKPRKALRAVEQAVDAMGGAAQEAMEYLLAYGLYDIDGSNTKYNGSYEIYLEDYESPFVLVNSIGYSEDTLTIAHEFGHFVDDFVNYGMYKSADVNETISQAMEYLTLCYLQDDALREELTQYKLVDALRLYAEQASYNAFEEQVYALPADQVTLENINAISLQTSRDYGLTGSWSDAYYAKSWIDISHFFDSPLYVISYCVSDGVAMQIYEQEFAEAGAGLAVFYDYVDQAPNETFADLAALCGLEDPLSADQIAALAATIEQQLFV